MKVGKRYRGFSSGQISLLVAIHEGNLIFRRSSGEYFEGANHTNWEEVIPEKWVSLWWTDKHKTNVSISSAFFDSQAEADGCAKASCQRDFFIKSVQVA